MIFRKFSCFLVIVAFIITGSSVEAYSRWEYLVNEPLSEEYVDLDNTVADIDYDKQEIRLPVRPIPDAIQFSNDGSMEYAVFTENGLSAFAFDGEEMVENPLISFTGFEDPVSFAMSSVPSPTIYVAEHSGSLIRQYRYGESSPSLGIAGLERVLSVSAYDTGEIVVLDKSKIQAYASVDNILIKIPALSINSATDPIAVATGSNYETAVLSEDGVKWFSFDGSELVENPFMGIAGIFVEPVTFAATDQSFAVLDEGKISLYDYSSSQNMVVMVTELTDLNSPQGVALRPGTWDMVVLDQKYVGSYNLRYFMFDGTEMVENPFLAQNVESILKGSGYINKGWITSKTTYTESSYADWLRIRANIELPDDTGIVWYITNTSNTWCPLWKAERSEGIINIYKYLDEQWVVYQGDPNDIYPLDSANESYPSIENLNQTLWIPVNEQDNSIRWKAEMYTNNKKVTPKIITRNNLSVVWEANAKPDAPSLNDPDDGVVDPYPEDYTLPKLERKEGWIYSTTPMISWKFSDHDEGDSQSAYQVRMLDRSIVNHENIDNVEEIEGAIIYDSDKQLSLEYNHRIETSENPLYRGPMWETGGYEFTVQVRVWDKVGVPSPWSTPTFDFLNADSFNVLAFERPRVVEVVDPPDSGDKGESHGPKIDDLDTHKVIKENSTKQELPKFRAGTWVTVRLDGVGPIDPEKIIVVFGYNIDDKTHVIPQDQVEIEKTGEFKESQQFDLKFFTDAPVKLFPDGTVVKMYAGGESIANIDAGKTILFLPPYAEGAAVSSSTAYGSWYVVLQGSEK